MAKIEGVYKDVKVGASNMNSWYVNYVYL